MSENPLLLKEAYPKQVSGQWCENEEQNGSGEEGEYMESCLQTGSQADGGEHRRVQRNRAANSSEKYQFSGKELKLSYIAQLAP